MIISYARERNRGCNFKWFHEDGDILYGLVVMRVRTMCM